MNKVSNRYFFDGCEVDVSTYSVNLARGIPGNYRIETRNDDTEYRLVEGLDSLNDKMQHEFDNLRCEMHSEMARKSDLYEIDRLKCTLKELIYAIRQKDDDMINNLSCNL